MGSLTLTKNFRPWPPAAGGGGAAAQIVPTKTADQALGRVQLSRVFMRMPSRSAGEDGGLRGGHRLGGADMHPQPFKPQAVKPTGVDGPVEQ